MTEEELELCEALHDFVMRSASEVMRHGGEVVVTTALMASLMRVYAAATIVRGGNPTADGFAELARDSWKDNEAVFLPRIRQDVRAALEELEAQKAEAKKVLN